MEAITEYGRDRLVILGAPGAGKTTILERLALELARQRLGDAEKGKIPFWVDLYNHTDDRAPSDFLAAEWQKTSCLAETYAEAIRAGKVCFLLDGLNQMPAEGRAARIQRWLLWATGKELPAGNWALFSCRLENYPASVNVPEVRVQDLDEAHMLRYFEIRFPEDAQKIAELWQEFSERLRSHSHRFEDLAKNPLTLSLLADNVREGKGLSDSRAQLMDALARRLLAHELIPDGRQPASPPA
ncbi:MAG: NACHT domain-containing protein [Chloroflexi bacterium]|nr:NACHT domain-containing protein [Chloroflexota bacterium]